MFKQNLIQKIVLLLVTFLLIFNFRNNVQAVSFISKTGAECSYPDSVLDTMSSNYYDIWNDNSIAWLCWKGGSTYYLQGLVLNSDSIVCYNNSIGALGVSKKGGLSDNIIIKHMLNFNSDGIVTSKQLNANVNFVNWSTGALGVPVEKNIVYFKNCKVYSDINGDTLFYYNSDITPILSLSLSNSSSTSEPIQILTQSFTEEEMLSQNCEYSTDSINWNSCNIKSFKNTDTGVTTYQYYVNALKNGTYYFRLITGSQEIYATMKITNIIDSDFSDNPYYSNDSILQPFLFYNYIGEHECEIYTQSLSFEQMQKFTCQVSNDLENWVECNIKTMKYVQTSTTEYMFYHRTTEDGTYYFRFYNTETGEYTGYSSIKIIFDKMDEYIKEQESKNYYQSKNEDLMKFFSSRFGFLTYPFELIYEILDKISSVDYNEPIINIPDIYEPFSNEKIISAQVFNFNDFLKENSLKTVHDIYLVVVDVILIFGFLNLAKNKILEVFSK